MIPALEMYELYTWDGLTVMTFVWEWAVKHPAHMCYVNLCRRSWVQTPTGTYILTYAPTKKINRGRAWISLNQIFFLCPYSALQNIHFLLSYCTQKKMWISIYMKKINWFNPLPTLHFLCLSI